MAERDKPWLDVIDHTADVGIVVRAGDLRTLFVRAAWGMFSLITDPEKVSPVEAARISVSANDRDELLRNWLSELNYRHVAEQRVFGSFAVSELTEVRAEGEARGERLDPARHDVFGEVKAVTFHGLKVAREGGQWVARVIFDV